MSNCMLCDDDIFDDCEQYYKDIMVCRKCLDYLSEHDQVDGKLVIDRCKECGHVKNVSFVKYKKRGRPTGSKNEAKIDKAQKTLDC